MSAIINDSRPPAGWSERPNDTLVFVQHDAAFVDEPPKREGFVPYFIARHGVGPGTWTSWSYKRLPREETAVKRANDIAERVASDNATDYVGRTGPNGFGGTFTVLTNLGPDQEGMRGWDLYEVMDEGIRKRWTSAVLRAVFEQS